MVPFKLILELKTNMLLPANPLCLDALLASLIDAGTSSFEKTNEILSSILKQTDGIYHASSLIYGITDEHPLLATTSPTVRLSRPETDLCPRTYKPDNKGKYKKHKVVSGDLKNQLKLHRALWSPYVVFYGCGDMRSVKEYLDFCLLGIGRSANRKGFGAIGRIYAKEINTDLSLIDDEGKPNRPLSEALFRKISDCKDTQIKPKVRVQLPYFDPLNAVAGDRKSVV